MSAVANKYLENNFSPSLLDVVQRIDLTPETCGLENWIRNVPQKDWIGLVHGHPVNQKIPELMMEEGPLRSAILHEYAFRSVAEERATRMLSYLVLHAPSIATMEFYATQLVDEARHSDAFRHHLIELGISKAEIFSTINHLIGEEKKLILDPLEEFGIEIMRDNRDFIGGVVILTILVEGVLAPSSELSERKWKIFDPLAGEIGRIANIDEVRHLAVGATIVKQYLQEHKQEETRLIDLILRGFQLWNNLPLADVVLKREFLFQQGMEKAGDLLGDYELVPRCRLVDTTAEERLGIAQKWSKSTQDARLRYMGLGKVLDAG